MREDGSEGGSCALGGSCREGSHKNENTSNMQSPQAVLIVALHSWLQLRMNLNMFKSSLPC